VLYTARMATIDQRTHRARARGPLKFNGWLRLAGWLSILGGFGLAGCAKDAAPKTPIIVVVFDAFDGARAGHAGYPRDTTPHLDALAAEGFGFRKAFAPAPYTLAGVASLLTGRLPDSHGLVSKKMRLADDETTLGELAKGAGYATFAVVGNPNGGPIFGNMQGFDQVVLTYEMGPDRPANYTPPSLGTPLHMSMPEEAAQEFARWRSTGALETPWLFYAHMLQPHTPYNAPEPFRSTWLDPHYAGVFQEGDNQTLIQHKWRTEALSDEDLQALQDLYDANILWADHGLGLLIDELKAAGLYEESLIIVTADHGEASYEHGVRGHNDTLFDEMLQVPMVVRFPNSWTTDTPRGTLLDTPVSTMDVLPTIAEFLDRAVPQAVNGQSLIPLIHHPKTVQERSLWLRDHGTPPSIGLRTSATKAIWHRDRQGPDRRPLRDAFLYFDLDADAEELAPLDDLLSPATEWIEPATEALRIYAKRVGAIKSKGPGAEVSSADEAMMGALGYVDEPAPAPAENDTKDPDENE
jgi:arylsulfatase A-like enzyme